MARIYIGATKGRFLASKLIRRLQWGYPYTHVFFVLGDHDTADPYVIEAWWYGVRAGFLSKAHKKGTEFTIFAVEGSEGQERQIKSWLWQQVGKGYDWFRLLGLPLPKHTENPKRWFCSELVFAALQQAGINLLRDTKPYEVSPRLLLKSPLLAYIRTDYVR